MKTMPQTSCSSCRRWKLRVKAAASLIIGRCSISGLIKSMALCTLFVKRFAAGVLYRPWLDTETPTLQSPMVENIAAYEHHQREQHRQRLQREGRDIDDMFPAPPAEPMPALEKLAEFVDGMEQRAEAHYREILDGAQANGIDIDGQARRPFRRGKLPTAARPAVSTGASTPRCV